MYYKKHITIFFLNQIIINFSTEKYSGITSTLSYI